MSKLATSGAELGSALGPVPVCLASFLTPLTAGPEAGEREVRHGSVYAVGVVLIVIALGAGIAAQLPSLLPMPLLLGIAGLGLVGVMAEALGGMVRGPLFGLGPLFWALVIGTAISLVLEAGVLRELRARAVAGADEG